MDIRSQEVHVFDKPPCPFRCWPLSQLLTTKYACGGYFAGWLLMGASECCDCPCYRCFCCYPVPCGLSRVIAHDFFLANVCNLTIPPLLLYLSLPGFSWRYNLIAGWGMYYSIQSKSPFLLGFLMTAACFCHGLVLLLCSHNVQLDFGLFLLEPQACDVAVCSSWCVTVVAFPLLVGFFGHAMNVLWHD